MSGKLYPKGKNLLMWITTNMYHFVYLSFEESPSGRDYIGVHSTEDLNDGYLGSFKDDSFNPTAKIILQFCSTRKGAVEAEIQWQHVFKVVEDPGYANRAYQTSKKFDTSGGKVWHDPKGRHTVSHTWPGTGWEQGPSPALRNLRSERFQGSKNPNYGKEKNPESNRKRSEALRGPKNHNYGKPRDPEVCEKISITKSGVATGSTWWVNGEGDQETHARECPGEGWVPGRLKRKWWINAEGVTKHSVNSPGSEWRQGRI
jgi:hypothetical protein